MSEHIVPAAADLLQLYDTLFGISKNVARAIPHVKDGLKPVQRKILYTIHGMGKPDDFKKVGTIMGEVLKIYNHGDVSAADALIRMGSNWGNIAPYITPHGNFGCHDDQTEVLTSRGWKFFKDILEEDEFATVNPRNWSLLWEKPTRVYCYDYNDKLLHCQRDDIIDFRVTPTHRMIRQSEKSFQVLTAEEMQPPFNIRLAIVNKQKIVPKLLIGDGWYTTDTLSILTNMILVNGVLDEDGIIGIKTNRKIAPAEVKTILQQLNVYVDHIADRTVYIQNKNLVPWFKEHWGRVPAQFFHLGERQLRVFLNLYATYSGNHSVGGNTYVVKHEQLSDDLSALIYLSGSTYLQDTPTWVVNQESGVEHKEYVFHEIQRKTCIIRKSDLLRWEEYHGKVYCAEVPTYHTLITRRNGKILISGNSVMGDSAAAPRYLEAKISPFALKCFFTDKSCIDMVPNYDGTKMEPETLPSMYPTAIVNGSTGSGYAKAQPVDTIIPTPNGDRRLGDLQIGDQVFTRKGTPARITDIADHGKKDVYEVILQDGRSTKCCIDHLWKIHISGEEDQVIPLKELIPLQDDIDCQIPVAEPVQFPSSPVPYDPWVLGVGLGSYRFNDRFEFVSPSTEIADRIRGLTGWSYEYRDIGSIMGHSTIYTFSIQCDTSFITYLNDIYRTGKLPSCYQMNDIHTRQQVLVGIMDIAGVIPGARCTSPTLIIWNKIKSAVLDLIHSLGYLIQFTPLLYSTPLQMDGLVVVFDVGSGECANLFSVSHKLPVGIEKFPKWKENYVTIRGIRKLDQQEECRCIIIDDEEHLYLTNDYIVTHNSSNIPQYNLKEVLDTTIKLIDNPSAKIKLIPDSHWGCDIQSCKPFGKYKTTFDQIFETGYGSYIQKFRYRIDHEKNIVIVTALPAKVVLEDVLKEIERLQNESKAFPELKSMVDLSGKDHDDGVWVEFHLYEGKNPYRFLSRLETVKDMKKTMKVNVDLVDGLEVVHYSIREYLLTWYRYRHDYLRACLSTELNGVISDISINNIKLFIFDKDRLDRTTEIYVSSKDQADIIARLMKEYSKTTGMTSQQAAILSEMSGKDYTKAALEKYKELKVSLQQEYDRLNGILENPNGISNIIKEQLQSGYKYSVPRVAKVIDESSVVEDERVILAIQPKNGTIIKLSDTEEHMKLTDVLPRNLCCSLETSYNAIILDDRGRYVVLNPGEIPMMEKLDQMVPLNRYIDKQLNNLVAMEPLDETCRSFLVLTKLGKIKKINPSSYRNRVTNTYISLDDGDQVVSIVGVKSDASHVIVYTDNGDGQRFPANILNVTSVTAQGNYGFHLPEGSSLLGGFCVNESDLIVYVTKSGCIRANQSKYLRVRKNKNDWVHLIDMKGADKLVSIVTCSSSDTLHLVYSDLTTKDIPVKEIPIGTMNTPPKPIAHIAHKTVITARKLSKPKKGNKTP